MSRYIFSRPSTVWHSVSSVAPLMRVACLSGHCPAVGFISCRNSSMIPGAKNFVCIFAAVIALEASGSCGQNTPTIHGIHVLEYTAGLVMSLPYTSVSLFHQCILPGAQTSLPSLQVPSHGPHAPAHKLSHSVMVSDSSHDCSSRRAPGAAVGASLHIPKTQSTRRTVAFFSAYEQDSDDTSYPAQQTPTSSS